MTGAKPMNPQTTAIVMIEYQNDFTTPGGVFHDGVKEVMQSNNMLSNTVDVANKCRAAGVAVMHAPISFAEDYGELTGHPYGILKGVVDNKAFRKGSWGATIVDVLTPHPHRTSSSRESAASTPLPAPTLISSCEAREYRPSCWAASSPIAAWSRRCAVPTNAASTLSR